MKKLMIATLFTLSSTMALAATVIMDKTHTWKNVPITIDDSRHVYTVGEGVLPEGDYYYNYPGYRCLGEQIQVAGVNPVIYHPSATTGNDIYCYPE